MMVLQGSWLLSFVMLGCTSANTFAPRDAGAVDGRGPVTDAAASFDAGGTDARPLASDASPSSCNPNLAFCDGFESELTNWSQTYVSGGTVTVDSTHVYRGAYALHAHVDAVTEAGTTVYAMVQRIQQWPGHVFARFFVYQPSPIPPSPGGLLDLLTEYSPYAGIEVLTIPPSAQLAMKTYSTGQDLAAQSDAGTMALDQWTCFELEVDTAAGTSHLYMNDTEVPDLAETHLGLPQLGILGVGLSFFVPAAQGAQDLWVDDVAVNGTRIGCAN